MYWTCPSCQENKTDPIIVIGCNHVICTSCAETNSECPLKNCNSSIEEYTIYEELRNFLQRSSNTEENQEPEIKFSSKEEVVTLNGYNVPLFEIKSMSINREGTPNCCEKTWLDVTFKDGTSKTYHKFGEDRVRAICRQHGNSNGYWYESD